MKITRARLRKLGACEEAINALPAKGAELKDMVRLMTHEQQAKYAIYAAESVLKIYEAEYPDDKRPRNAIKAAKTYLENPTNKNKDKSLYAAQEAYYAAHYASDDPDTPYHEAYTAVHYAANAAHYAARLVHAADAAYAAYAAHYAARIARGNGEKIIRYGLKLLEEK